MSEYILYRAYGENNDLLYIGKSISIINRLKQHRDASQWWPPKSMTFEVFASDNELDIAEREAIVNEQPKFNIMFNGGNPLRVRRDIEKLRSDASESTLDGLFDHDHLPIRHMPTTPGINLDDIGYQFEISQLLHRCNAETDWTQILWAINGLHEKFDKCVRHELNEMTQDEYWAFIAWLLTVAVRQSWWHEYKTCAHCEEDGRESDHSRWVIDSTLQPPKQMWLCERGYWYRSPGYWCLPEHYFTD